LAGEVQVEAVDGGVLLMTPDGALWPIDVDDIVSRRSDDEAFQPLGREELIQRLAAELPGFKFHHTKNYVIGYNTSRAYAQWVGSLYERLHAAFYTYWTSPARGAALQQPQFPLVALVFDSQESYALYARSELGEATGSIIGYYSLRSNRMIMYDLTGLGTAADSDRAAPARIKQILAQPRAERTVATIVHEATHQLAFNSGLQVRFADVPFWVSEGIAIYFETPDLDSSRGWRKIGAVNRVNLINFRKTLQSRPPDALTRLISDDMRFRDSKSAADAYAEAWALTYFLLNQRAEACVKYLAALAEHAPLVELGPQRRIRMFQEHFGEDLTALEAEFLRYMQRVR
jgi:hypothetical protein